MPSESVSADDLLLRLARKTASRLRPTFPDGVTYDDAVSEAYILARKASDQYDAAPKDCEKAAYVSHRTLLDMRSLFRKLRLAARRDLRGRPTGIDNRVATELRADLREAMDCLTADQKDVVELTYFGGLTQVQIAIKRNCSQEAVSQTLSRALERLRVRMGGEPNES